MIEIHSHILHNLDDGPETLEDSLTLVKIAMEKGVTDIIATPHYKKPQYHNQVTNARFEELHNAVRLKGWDINIHLGNEIFLDEHTMSDLVEGKVFTLASTRYLLLELPADWHFPVYKEIIYELQKQGYLIVLAHVDRYHYFMNNPKLLDSYITRGCYTQFNVSYLLKNRLKFKKWFREGYVHFVSSDIHNETDRPCRIDDAKVEIVRLLGSGAADALLVKNPIQLLQNEPLLIEKITQRSLLKSLKNIFKE